MRKCNKIGILTAVLYMVITPKIKPSKKEQVMIRSAVSEAYQVFEKRMNAHALYKTHNLETSHDLVQSTFLKTLLYLQRGGKIDTMRSFLNHILNDLIVDEYRKRKTTSLDLLLEKGFEPGSDSIDRIINILDGKQAILLIALLPKKYERVMRMRYLQDLSLHEIALLTGQTQNTTTVQVCRGLAKLKELYKEVSAAALDPKNILSQC